MLGTILLIFLFFSRSARPLLARTRPLLVRLRVERRCARSTRASTTSAAHVRLLLRVFVFTTAIQAVRVLSIWAAGKAVGIDLGPRIYYVMGPLFFLVLLVPFTLNGFAVREAFFVSFLGSVGVRADQAFAAGFLFFLVTVALAVPGAVILLWEGFVAASRRGSSMADGGSRVAASSSRYNALPWIERCLRACAASRRSSSTTARATARLDVVRERFPAGRA